MKNDTRESVPASPSGSTDSGKQRDDLIVVGVGASAGGLEAFTELLRFLPTNTGMAFVLVQHLDPHHQSILSELLAVRTQMQVIQVNDGARLRGDCVFVIPPNALMRIRDHALVIETRPPSAESFKPIDVFLESLAEEYHFNAIGVVLSGTASDGTLGLRAIKAEGGITFAQNQTAKFDSMPRSAIAAGVVDFVLSPRRIAEELAALSRRTAGMIGVESALMADGATLHRLLLLLRNNTGVDFTQYKQPTILRRLRRRIVLRKLENLEQYFEFLKKEPEEARALFDDLLINVTDFFRDPDVFESAKHNAFPLIVRNRKPPFTIRAWIPGCSTGEEVYSMAISLVEFLEAEELDCRIQMFGTDVSETTIDRARAGIYSASAVANVPQERLRRFFLRTDSGYQISRGIREMCVFSRHNIAKDPPLTRMDLISCRNLLIYFSPSLQKRIVSTFGYALQPGGCLILGSSETLGTLADLFKPIDEKHKIYSKRTDLGTNAFQIADAVIDYAGLEMPSYTPHPSGGGDQGAQLRHHVNQILLSRFGPVGVVVDENLQITDYRGDVTNFLITPTMPPAADLMSVLRPELRASIRGAVEQARRTGVTVAAESSTGASDGEGPKMLDASVVPVSVAGVPPHFLVLFGPGGNIPAVPLSESAVPLEAEAPAPLTLEQENEKLKQELRSTREYLQSVIEELRSANEEAQSSNEELQSTNEEMQTSREELQSSNEELNTINTEMQSRNAELKQVNDDLLNLLGSMNVPIVMTGSDLRIRRFTPSCEKTLRLIATDVGRPIADLKPRINVPDLEEILRRVLDTLQPYEQEVQDQEGRSYIMRARPYRTADNRIEGTVLQLLDVTELKRSLEEVKHARDFSEAIVNTIREPLVVLDGSYLIQIANRAFYEVLGQSQAATVGREIFDVGGARFDQPALRTLLRQLEQGNWEARDIEIELPKNSGEASTFLVSVTALQSPDRKQLILMAFKEISERKRAAEARYRRLFESARDGILLVDEETGAILDANPFAQQLLGYRYDELTGNRVWEVEATREVPRIRAAIERIRDQGALRFDDVNLRTKDGRELQTEVIANVYSEGDRRAIQFNLRDVSERRKFEREIQESQRLESLGLVAGGVAHDFNNLLTGIMGHASLGLSETPTQERVRLRFRQILEASERASFLTRQMLAYVGRGPFFSTSIELADFIRELSALLYASIPRSVELRFDLAPDLPAIEGDPGQIQQVIMNLIINGAEAIGDNPGRVTIRTSARELNSRQAADLFQGRQSAAGTYVQLEVTDTGSGMDEATKARIFDPFFTTKFVGRGLGLAAVQGIVKSHGGAIRVYSTPGQGTTFMLLFPPGAREQAAKLSEGFHPPIPPGSVALVIDDEPAVRELAQDVLSNAGMKVLLAENGRSGATIFEEHHRLVSVVVLDLEMPAMGGEETLRLLREVNPNVPIILSSGFDETEARRRLGSLEPARFLQKPYTAERLREVVAAVMHPKD